MNRLAAALTGRYRIERELGAGGMATVYLAHDERHDRPVALKLLRPELSAILGAERFLSEIKTTANLQHPHILPLHDSGEADGLVFYVMPYVEGESLRDRLNRERQLPVEDALRIATEVADALEYAHQRGVIHRDIKPENILLHGGHALVADFGIALAVSRSDGGTRMTETGMSLGTPQYMSPEQAMGEREITPRADVYALGCVLYEMLAGEPPFTGPSAQAIVARVMTEEPRSLTLQRRTVPPHVEAVVRTALEKLPADRFATAGAFGRALGEPGWRNGTLVAATGVRGRPRAARLALAAVALLAVAGVGVGLGRRLRPPAPLTALQIVPPAEHRLLGNTTANIAVSPDGSRIAYLARAATPTGHQLFVRRLDAFDAEPVPGSENATRDPAFAPDGRSIVWAEADGAVSRAAGGGAPVRLAQDAVCCVLEATPSGVLLTTLRGASLTPLAGGAATPVRDVPLDGSAAGLPGRRWLLVLSPYLPRRVQRLDLVSGTLTPVGGLPDGVDAVRWSDGYLLFQVGTTLSAVRYRPGSDRVGGQPVPILQDVRLATNGAYHETQSAVAGGTLAYVPAAGNNRIVLVDRSGRETVIPDTTGIFHRPRFSPDGRRISVDVTRVGSRDVWVYDLDERTLTRVSFEQAGHDAIWTADGRSLLFLARVRDSLWGLMERRTDGSPQVDTVATGASLDAAEAIVHGGRSLVAYASGGQGNAWLVDRATGTHTVLLGGAFTENALSVSRDGLLAYASSESGRMEVYVRPLDGGPRLQVSTAGGQEPVWNPRGGELFYRTQVPGGSRLVAARLGGSPLHVTARDTLFGLDDYDTSTPHADYDVSPDGTRFVFTRQQMPNEIRVVRPWQALLARAR